MQSKIERKIPVIQLAKYAGYKVITTASKSNYAYVKSLGADYIFDYHDGECFYGMVCKYY